MKNIVSNTFCYIWQICAKDVITGQNVDLTHNIKLTPRQSLIIEF